MFIALRRFTLLCTIMLERFMYHKKHDPSTYGAVTTMILGAVQLLHGRPAHAEHWQLLDFVLWCTQHHLRAKGLMM